MSANPALKDAPTQPVRQMSLQPSEAVDTSIALVQMFERLASSPDVDVEKLDRLIQMRERLMAKAAQDAFSAAMAEAQGKIRSVGVDSQNTQTHSRYASYEALDRALRPVYTAHGFALSFNTVDSGAADVVRVVCRVTHSAGHSEVYRLDMPADGKGAKGGDVMTKTHATGSALSYGMRYLLKMIWNVATGEGDDDGNLAAATKAKDAPAGFDDWMSDIASAADEGTAALEKAWKASKPEFRRLVLVGEWETLKKKAAAKVAPAS